MKKRGLIQARCLTSFLILVFVPIVLVAGECDFGVQSVAIDPVSKGAVYLGTERGIFKSVDGGKQWSEINQGLTDLRVEFLAFDPHAADTIYSASQGGGIFISTDGGKLWVFLGLENRAARRLAIDPADTSTMYAGTWGMANYKSTDGGANWSPIGPGSLLVHGIVVNPDNPSLLYTAGVFGVYKSINGGQDWVAFQGPFIRRVNSLAVDATSWNRFYFGTEGGKVYRTNDGGESIFESTVGTTGRIIATLAIDPSNPNAIYAGTVGEGVFKSLNAGESWISMGLSDRAVWSLAIDPSNPNILYAGMYRGLFKTSDQGETWVDAGLCD